MIRCVKEKEETLDPVCVLFCIMVKTAFSSSPSDTAELLRRLERLKRLAWVLNSAVRIPGLRMRAGVDTVLGLIPGGGLALGTLLSLYIVWEGHRMGVKGGTIRKMLLNVGIEAAIGVIPLMGDVFDTVFKADMRNVRLIEEALARPETGAPHNSVIEKNPADGLFYPSGRRF